MFYDEALNTPNSRARLCCAEPMVLCDRSQDWMREDFQCLSCNSRVSVQAVSGRFVTRKMPHTVAISLTV